MARLDNSLSGDDLQHRANALRQLVNRYTTQIRYGCRSETCDHPHCWTCRKRLATAPPRRPTLFTARIQAYALATRRDPYAALCLHEPAEATASNTASEPVEARPVTKDTSSLVQCLLDTTSFTSFEHGRVGSDGNGHRSFTAGFDAPDHTVDSWLTRQRKVRECMRQLKQLFVRPPQLSSSQLRSSTELPALEKLEILTQCAKVAFDIESTTRTVPSERDEPELEFADRLVRAIAAQRCHWELANLASRPVLPYPGAALLLRNLLPGSCHRDLEETSRADPRLSLTEYIELVRAKYWTERPSGPVTDYFFRGCSEELNLLPPLAAGSSGSEAVFGVHAAPDQADERTLQMLSNFSTSLAVLLRQRWTGANVVRRWDTIGATLELLQDMDQVWQFGRHCPLSEMGAFRAVIEQMFRNIVRDPRSQELTVSFYNYETNPNTQHMLSFPMLFDDAALVKHFRTLNYINMLGSYRQTHFYDLFLNIGPRKIISDEGLQYLEERLKAARARFLTLDVDRRTVVEDAFNQLRGREKRELARPLKVLIGRSEAGGEIGIDQGGLTQEFFALAAVEAFNEDFGMFVTDDQFNFSWFRPLSPVPLYKFELLGLLFSLALYNGAILPVNLPLALYRRLLGQPLTDPLATISDAWPDLAKSFQFIASWKEHGEDGQPQDIADALMREYTFSLESPFLPDPLPEGWTASENTTARGFLLEYDLHQQNAKFKAQHGIGGGYASQAPVDASQNEHPQSSSETWGMVTNANRLHYIRDYVDFLLIDSIRPQYEAFAKGFRTLLTPKALSLLNPLLLQRLVEGDHSLSVDELERHAATYENGYFPTHPVIKQFWSTVRSWTPEKQRKLLEFVTASDRVPVTGLSTVAFSIVRNGAVEDLPTSQTCFGKFNLPEYESREKLEKMLDIALEYGQGFGVM